MKRNEVLISPIVRIELLSFSQLTQEEIVVIEGLLSQFESAPILREIEDLTILLKRQSKIKLPDAVVAATALHHAACLVTRNVQDFKQISGLSTHDSWIDGAI